MQYSLSFHIKTHFFTYILLREGRCRCSDFLNSHFILGLFYWLRCIMWFRSEVMATILYFISQDQRCSSRFLPDNSFIYIISCHLEWSIVVHLNKEIVVFITRGNARFATFLKTTFRHSLYLMYVLCLHYSFTKKTLLCNRRFQVKHWKIIPSVWTFSSALILFNYLSRCNLLAAGAEVILKGAHVHVCCNGELQGWHIFADQNS